MLPVLPQEILDQIQPVLASVGAEVHTAVMARTRRDFDMFGRAAVSRNGGTGSGHDQGMQAIRKDIFSGVTQSPSTTSDASQWSDSGNDDDADDDGECECEDCEDSRCDGDCDPCGNHQCYQCHEINSCCGTCNGCDSCHTDSADHDRGYLYTSNGGHGFCVRCRHFCND